MKWFKQQSTYTQEETNEQIYQIKQLTELRNRCSDKTEIEKYNTAIDIAQEILTFMLETVNDSHKK